LPLFAPEVSAPSASARRSWGHDVKSALTGVGRKESCLVEVLFGQERARFVIVFCSDRVGSTCSWSDEHRGLDQVIEKEL
jgi:hypothetical protein